MICVVDMQDLDAIKPKTREAGLDTAQHPITAEIEDDHAVGLHDAPNLGGDDHIVAWDPRNAAPRYLSACPAP